jgi:hypothetical protein
MTASAPAILFSEMTPPVGEEDVFNRWYDEEHIPVRMAAPRFISARRYRDGTTQNYLAVYELESQAALSTPEYQRIKQSPADLTRRMLAAVRNFTRYTALLLSCRSRGGDAAMLDSSVLYAAFFTVPPEKVAEFDAWYEEDHIPLLMREERWLGVRRFAVLDGQPHPFNRLTLHHLSDRSALNSEARERARATPWRARLASQAWFRGHYLLFDALGPRFRAQP